MPNPDEPYVEKTVTEQPATIRTEQVSYRGGGSAGWWIAALVAIVAIVGLIFVFNNSSSPSDLQAARDSGRSEALIDTATAQSQTAAADASQAASRAAASMSSAARSAADSASAAADRTAEAASDAAANASGAAKDAADTAPPQQ